MVIKLQFEGLGEVKIPTEVVKHYALDDLMDSLHRDHFDSQDERVTAHIKGNRHEYDLRLPIGPFEDFFILDKLPTVDEARKALRQCRK